jgi:hypothetical protein
MGRMGRLAVTSILGVTLLLACGGRTLEEPFSDTNTSGVLLPDGGRVTAPPAATPTGGSGSPNDTDRFDGTVRLPACKLGFDPLKAPGKDCPFVTSGRCYSTKIAACACACPDKNGTTCVSGFPDFNDQVLVTCS